jgi:hypothetical protein
MYTYLGVEELLAAACVAYPRLLGDLALLLDEK